MEKVALLLLCDHRGEIPTAALLETCANFPPDSLVSLPQKREILKLCAQQHAVQIEGEAIVEIDEDSEPEEVLKTVMEDLAQYKINSVLSLDGEALKELGLLGVLLARLQSSGLEFINVEIPD
jgi:hypothetical protein